MARVFFICAMVIAAILCIGECVLLVLMPELSGYYTKYLIFLLSASVGGAFAVTFIYWLADRKLIAESARRDIRLAEIERQLSVLEDTANRREEFIASFAHELKTPLTAIIGYADMLRSKDMAPKPRFTAAGYIFSEGKRLEALSIKLMDIIVAGRQSYELRRYDAGYLIREVAVVSVPSTGGDGLSLDIRWDRGTVEIEPDLFKTLLINLVDNARKASRPGQKVELYGRAEAGGYAFYVKDRGRGMEPEELARITEPFYMIDKSRSRAQNGAGLGLALCQRIAQLHNAALEFESAPGVGTTARVFLPGEGEA